MPGFWAFRFGDHLVLEPVNAGPTYLLAVKDNYAWKDGDRGKVAPLVAALEFAPNSRDRLLRFFGLLNR